MHWLAPADFYQLFRYLWAAPQREGVDGPWIFWQRRRSRGENRSDFGWALELSVAFCKVNLILCSMRLSMGGADPLIDDQTPLSCLSKQPTQKPTRWTEESCGEVSIDAKSCPKKKKKKKKRSPWCFALYCVQRGPDRAKTSAGGPQSCDLWTSTAHFYTR